MRPAHPVIRYPALLLASLALGGSPPARAQDDPGLSSGSGAGTATGRSSAIDDPIRAPRGPQADGSRAEGEGAPPAPRSSAAPLGPGANVRFPDDPSLAPFLLTEVAPAPAGGGGMRITPEMIETAKLISEPGERGRILLQIARGAILGNQLTLANRALEEAAAAAVEEPNRLIHDQLVISIVTVAGQLSDALLREAKPQLTLFPADAEGAKGPERMAPDVAIRLARLEWRRAAYMARQTRNPTYRSEYLDRAVENMAVGSAVVALEFGRPRGDRTAEDVDDERAGFARQADEILLEGAELAQGIERPIWKNRAMERLATAAGESGQYERATELADRIRNAEARARALILVAEFQARKGRDADATRSYALAAEAVASIEQRGLRGVLSGILIDSLVSTGRFDDARAALVLYSSDAERFVAMGAIAESLGVRRMEGEARRWIQADAPAEFRSTLFRRLSNGLLRAISEDRAREFQDRESPAGRVD